MSRRSGLLLAAGAVLALILAPGLRAQSRGDLQVAARVLPVRPHQEALDLARALAVQPAEPLAPAGGRTTFATVRVEARGAAGAESRARRVVTVSFLRN